MHLIDIKSSHITGLWTPENISLLEGQIVKLEREVYWQVSDKQIPKVGKKLNSLL